jgi:hypothetical protein
MHVPEGAHKADRFCQKFGADDFIKKKNRVVNIGRKYIISNSYSLLLTISLTLTVT